MVSLSKMFGSRSETGLVHLRKVKQWVRDASNAGEDDSILVTELVCGEPGCAPFEVVMAVLSVGGKKRQRKLHRRLTELNEEQVLAAWQSEDWRAP